MVYFLIVAEDGSSWYSTNEKEVWDAADLWADGYYDIFKIDVTKFEGGVLDGTLHTQISQLDRTENSELVWKEVKSPEEVKASGRDE